MRKMDWIPCIVLASTAAATSAKAVTVNDMFSLTASQQSIWSAASDSFSASGSVDTGNFNKSITGGGIANIPLLGKNGAEGTLGISGDIGLSYSAGGTGGAVNVTAANNTSIAVTRIQNNFGITVGGGMTGLSNMSYLAPQIQAAVNGKFILDASLTAEGCILNGCKSFGSNGDLLNINDPNVSIVGFDSTAATPLTVFGKPVTLPGLNNDFNIDDTGVSIGFFPPHNVPGPGTFNPTSTIALDANNVKVLRLGFDPVQAFLPELNPSLTLSIGPVSETASLTSIKPDFGLDLGLDNNLTANVPEMVDLKFSAPVDGTYGNGVSIGPTTDVIFGIHDPRYDNAATLSWVGARGEIVSRTYEADSAQLLNNTNIDLGGDLALSVGCASLSGVFSFGPECLYQNDFPFGSVPINVFNANVPLTFSEYAAGAIAVPAPEPSTWAMFALGFAAIGFAGHRRSRPARSIVCEPSLS
jgi:hypothetical protein